MSRRATASLIAVIVLVCASTVTYAVYGIEDNGSRIDPVYKWTNTDVVDNVYPAYSAAEAKDNFYAYAHNESYSDLASFSDVGKALKKYNSGTIYRDHSSTAVRSLTGLFEYGSKATGDDAALFGMYLDMVKDSDKTAEIALVDSYIAEIEEIDTAAEFEAFVKTGGTGAFRDIFTTKLVSTSMVDGKTALYLEYGTFPWHLSANTRSDSETESIFECYRNVLSKYFADDPEKAKAYADDLEYACDKLIDSIDEYSFKGVSYSDLEGMLDNYPLESDVSVYREVGLDSFVLSDTSYLEALDDIVAKDDYRYARAIAVYAVLSESSLHMGLDYAGLMLGEDGDATPSLVIINEFYNPTYGAYCGKYYTQVYGESFRDELTVAAYDIQEAARNYFNSLDWLSDETKGKISDKINAMIVHACGPEGDMWTQLDYTSALTADNLESLSASMRAANEDILLKQCLQDRGEFWPLFMMPQVYNAHYMFRDNSMYLNTAFFQSIYVAGASLEEVYAEAYTVIAHELTHGFDSNGAQFDGSGIYDPDWLFTDDEADEFESRVSHLVDYLDGIAVSSETAINGDLVKREVTADMGGLAIVHLMAKGVADFDYAEFYETYSDIFSIMYTAEGYEASMLTNTHLSALYRVNINLMQFQKFFDTYGIVEGDNMYLAESINPWR